MTAPVRAFTYRCGGCDEWMLARGPAEGLQTLLVPPLFEEANRCRTLLADVQRGLAAAGIGSAIIDLPGTGESETPLEDVTLDDWIDAVAQASATLALAHGPSPVVASFRGGALVDGGAQAAGWWRLTPVDGAALLRDLDRASQVASRRDGAASDVTHRAGYRISDALAATLGAARPPEVRRLRTVRLATEAVAADARVAGPPLWRRAEPVRDYALATAITDDLAAWVRTCAV